MNRYETISEGIQIAHGDCLDLMRDIPDGSVDMVLCDLPYGTTSNSWDTVIPFKPLWMQYERACKETVLEDRKFIGIELDECYYQVGKDRLTAECAQGSLAI